MNSTSTPTRLAVLISGGGTTLKNLLDKIDAGQLDAEIRLVVSSNPTSQGLYFADEAGIPAATITRSSCATADEFSQKIFDTCRAVGVRLVIMAGFLKHVPIPDDFAGRVINIHPSLIPKHSGQGFYGLRVHSAVLAAGDKESGCTVHFVDNVFDHGPIILQREVPVENGDTPESLAKRVFAVECEALPEAISLVASGHVRCNAGRVIRDES